MNIKISHIWFEYLILIEVIWLIFVSEKTKKTKEQFKSWFKFNANNSEILPMSVSMQMSKLQGAQIQMFKRIYIEHSHAPVHVQMHMQTRWLEGGLWLWQASLSASLLSQALGEDGEEC